MVILEQFKNNLPERVSTYISERKVVTAGEAAVAADEYILLHKSSFRERHVASDFGAQRSGFDAPSDMMRLRKIGHMKPDGKTNCTFDNYDVCNYCHEQGHWNVDCAVLKAKTKGMKTNFRPVAFAATVKTDCVYEVCSAPICEADVLAAYAPFIREGSVSLVGGGVKTPLKILRDTGAYNSSIVSSVLPFSGDTDTGDFVLSRGMGLSVFPAPLHKMVLDCELVQGEVDVGVLSALPIEGIHLILGNGLAGSRVWASTPPSPKVTLCPSEFLSDKGSGALQEVSPACVVTRAMRKMQHDELSVSNSVDVPLEVPSLAELPLSLSHGEVVQEQRNDVSLKEIFQCVSPALVMWHLVTFYMRNCCSENGFQ